MAFSVAMDGAVAKEDDALADLSQRVAEGDSTAIVLLYNEYHVHVRAFARRLLGDVALAEDLVHEVFLAAPKAFCLYRGECSVRSYLVSIAAGRAKHLIRAAARRRALETRLAREERPPPSGPAEHAERHELAARLNRAMDSLTTEHRVAFVLCEVEERSSVEVASLLGEKDGTIRARVFHAKKKLREWFENDGGVA